MDERQLRALLQQYREGEISEGEALEKLKYLPYETLGFATLDHHRYLRQGFPEVVFAEGKNTEHLLEITDRILRRHRRLLITRISEDSARTVLQKFPQLYHNPTARILATPIADNECQTAYQLYVMTAGTSDIPVAEEARETLRALQFDPQPLYDVGVAGLHRLAEYLPKLQKAHGIIVVAGMEGALASVIGGAVACPVIAVPTSVGYGASFRGLAALLTMLNSCAAGVTVVNIDNGFGAAFALARMIQAFDTRQQQENQSKGAEV